MCTASPHTLVDLLLQVSTVFIALSFDPHSNGSAAAAGGAGAVVTGGMTRLSFSADGEEVPVANLTRPITFTLASSPATADGSHTACSFWDDTAAGGGRYRTEGCWALPTPRPPNHTVAWAANLSTPDDASLALSWSVSGPLLAGCTHEALRCAAAREAGNATELNRKLFMNPMNPFQDGFYSCGNLTSGAPVLRVWYGESCAVYSKNNSFGCWWDAASQQFSGPGCVASESVQCACRHLTGARPVSLPCSSTHKNCLAPRPCLCLLLPGIHSSASVQRTQ